MLLPEGYARLYVEACRRPIGAVTASRRGGAGATSLWRGATGWRGCRNTTCRRGSTAAVEAASRGGDCAPPCGERRSAVPAGPDGPALAAGDRAAGEALGLLVRKVCLVGIVQRVADGEPPCVWLARRGDDQRTAPGLLDTTVAGACRRGGDGETLRTRLGGGEPRGPSELERRIFPRGSTG